MKPKPWDKLPDDVRAAAVGAAGRALVAEMCGLEVRSVRVVDGKPVLRFFGDAVRLEDWQEAAMNGAAGSARVWYFDNDTTKAGEFKGVWDEIGHALHPVAVHVASGETLFRAAFLHLFVIRSGVDKVTAGKVRNACERVGREIVSKRRGAGS